jgi:hypothetical protein
MDKTISILNSTNNILLANNSFTGVEEKIVKYESVTITLFSDVSSANNGIKIYLGATTDNMINKFSYSYTAEENKTISIQLTDRYFKLEYINGSTEQNSFSIQTFYSHNLPPATISLPESIDVKLSDAAGNGITSTDTALDVNIKSGTLNIYDESKYDLFGNLKTSNSFTLLDIEHIYDKNPLLMDEFVSAGASSTYMTNNASVLMGVSANTHVAIRQSRLYTTYQPGKSLCIRMTGVLNANTNANNTTSRIGYFDEKNGLFFQYSGGIYSVVKRKTNSDATITDTTINRNNWNDPLDGTGASGVTVDFTKNIIYFIEFAFLGVGIVKFGVVYNGTLYIAYKFTHTTLTYPYISTPNLPLRWELSSTGGSGQLICTCGSVQSEGGYNNIGNPFSIGVKTSPLVIDSAITAETYTMAIRIKTNMRKLIKLVSLSIICTSGSSAIYSLHKVKSPTTNPISINSGSPPAVSFTGITNSSVEYQFNSSTSGGTPVINYKADLSNAELLYRNYFTANESLNFTNFSNIGGPIYLTAGIDTTNYGGAFYSDYLIMTVQQLSNQDETYYVAFNWIEV